MIRGNPVEVARFIPACAGNALRAFHWTIPPAVHPRVCGERAITLPAANQSNGSSPRVRGTQFHAWEWDLPRRFIPACAGNASLQPVDSPRPTVHPRVCGERLPSLDLMKRFCGSSPRVRGTLTDPRIRYLHHRFIPACAGNALMSIASISSSVVHPRVCGGTHPITIGEHEVFRFIPACAGNAICRSMRHAAPSVHPRVCGER